MSQKQPTALAVIYLYRFYSSSSISCRTVCAVLSRVTLSLSMLSSAAPCSLARFTPYVLVRWLSRRMSANWRGFITMRDPELSDSSEEKAELAIWCEPHLLKPFMEGAVTPLPACPPTWWRPRSAHQIFSLSRIYATVMTSSAAPGLDPFTRRRADLGSVDTGRCLSCQWCPVRWCRDAFARLKREKWRRQRHHNPNSGKMMCHL